MNLPAHRRSFIDPSYKVFYEDRLFDLSDLTLNRDNQLLPFARLRASLESRDVCLQTADYLLASTDSNGISDYYSLGLVDNYKTLTMRPDVRLRAFVILEPPVIAPALYKALPELTAVFERVYVHNTIGDGYPTQGVDMSRLRQIYWPMPHNDVLMQYWKNEERLNRVVVINGNHIPVEFNNELYSRRIEAMASLAKMEIVDLYGQGWSKWWSRSSMWSPYWRHRRTLMSIYKGACESKYEVLSRYRFSLCFENMEMSGYMTEKLFDCLYAGVIPIYLGPPNVASLIPAEIYIDVRAYSSWSDLWARVSAMNEVEIAAMRHAGRSFLQSEAFLKYFYFLSANVFAENEEVGPRQSGGKLDFGPSSKP